MIALVNSVFGVLRGSNGLICMFKSTPSNVVWRTDGRGERGWDQQAEGSERVWWRWREGKILGLFGRDIW